MHAGQIQGFFNIPVDELTALPLLVKYFRDKSLDNLVVAGVDIGISKRARDVAERLDVPLAIIEKRRDGNSDMSESLNVIGDVEGATVLAFDDEIDTGGSMLAAIESLSERGVKEVYSCVTHPVLSGNAPRDLANSSIKELVVTDTIPLGDKEIDAKVTTLSIAPLLGEAIHRIHRGLSVGAMFQLSLIHI